jgi:hypothetical protein
MSRPLRTVLLAAALALCAAPVATAHHSHRRHDALIAPAHGGGLTGDELLGEAWARGLVFPAGQDPFAGRCITLAHNVIAPHLGEDGTATCHSSRHTRLLIFFGSACSNVETDSCTGDTHVEQLAAAVAEDRAIEALKVTVDTGRTVDLVRPRFELFSPQRTIQLPAGNVFGVPPRTATFSAHAWGAVIRRLGSGHHTVTFEVVAPAYGPPLTLKVFLEVA